MQFGLSIGSRIRLQSSGIRVGWRWRGNLAAPLKTPSETLISRLDGMQSEEEEEDEEEEEETASAE